MMASRGMGAIRSSKMPKGTEKARRDDTDFTEYKKGGKVKKFEEGGKTLAEQAKEKIAEYNSSNSGVSSTDAVPFVEAMGGKDKYGIGGGGKAGFRKKLDEDTDISAYLEGGGFKPKTGNFQGKIMGGGVSLNKRFNGGGLAKQAATAIAMKEAGKKPKKMAAGGKTKSKVNAAGNYTKPELRKRIFNSVKAAAIVGTGAGQWSARKAQVMAKRYKAAGGGYRD